MLLRVILRPLGPRRHMKLSPAQLVRMSRLLDEVVDVDDAGAAAVAAGAGRRAPRPRAGAAAGAVAARRGRVRRRRMLPKLPRRVATQAPSGLHAGDMVGPYRLLRPLGAGGMAEVWLAQRADGAFTREVALKMPSRPRAARRPAAALRDRARHPGRAGASAHRALLRRGGEPRTAGPISRSKYVAGQNLLQWADEHRLAFPSGSSCSCRCWRRCSTRMTRGAAPRHQARQRAGHGRRRK